MKVIQIMIVFLSPIFNFFFAIVYIFKFLNLIVFIIFV